MKSNSGFFCIAFGKLHELYALASITTLRKYTNLPIVLATNISEIDRDVRLKGISNIEFMYFNLDNITGKENRRS